MRHARWPSGGKNDSCVLVPVVLLERTTGVGKTTVAYGINELESILHETELEDFTVANVDRSVRDVALEILRRVARI